MNSDILLIPAKVPSVQAANIAAPASKSISHRMLIAASLANGHTTLRGVLESEDTKATASILCACGAGIEKDGSSFNITGLGGNIAGGDNLPLDCNVSESGTTCRLLTAVLAAGHGLFRLHGAARMHERPMQGLVNVLGKLGAGFSYEQKPDHLPLVMKAAGLVPDELEVDTSDTSQYLSGLLLAAPLGQGLKLIPCAQDNAALVSWPYVLLTLQILEDFGISFKVEEKQNKQASWQEADWRRIAHPQSGLLRLSVQKSEYRAGEYCVEGDFSNSSYFLAAGAVGKRPVVVNNLRLDSLQGDRAILDILQRMGAHIVCREGSVEVSAPAGALQGVEVDMGDCPDLVPTVAAVAAFAKGQTTIRGVGHLRIKESDRISAPATELKKVGCETKELEDGLVIIPPAKFIQPVEPFCTYNDHRMAMSMSLFSCAGFDLRIENPACVSKSFPLFWEAWAKI